MTAGAGSEGTASVRPILVVDDEPSVLRITARIIHRLGYPTVEALSGEEAVRISGDHADGISLMVTDVVMGGLDGIQTAEEVRKQHRELPVLFMSGHTIEHLVRRHGFEESADFLQKPFTPAELSAKVREMLNAD
jgi:two-component system, cell cycle sensor histidine kinase and response regulator CckA